MPLKCRCVCSCKLLVSEKSAGKTIKCPKCARRLRVPTDAVQRREQQIAARKDPSAKERSKLRLPLSSLVDLPEPEPPPVVERLDLREASPADAEALSPSLVDQILADDATESADATAESVRAATSPKPPSRPSITTSEEEGAATSALLADMIEPSATPTVDSSIPPLMTPEPSVSATPLRAQAAPIETLKAETPAAPPPLVNESVATFTPAGKSLPPPRVARPLVAPPSSKTSEPVAPPPSPNVAPELPPKKQGYLLDRDRLATVRWLAGSVLALAIVGIVPAVWDIVEYFRSTSSLGLSRWAYALLLIGVIQAAYAFYLAQLPDWSSVWVVTFVSLAIAVGYAAMLGFT